VLIIKNKIIDSLFKNDKSEAIREDGNKIDNIFHNIN